MTLHETFKAIGQPECHARGFIPFCLDNPKLHIIRRIILLDTFLPSGGMPAEVRETWILTCECLEVMVPWIEEAVSLPAHGMPKDAFELVIDGTARESSEAWEIIKDAAAMQEARLRQCRVSGTKPEPRPSRPDYSGYGAFWSLPIDFAQMIRDITQGKSNVRYDGDVGELWDQDQFFSKRKAWTQHQWVSDWEKTVNRHISTGRWRYIANRYSVRPQALRTMRTLVRNGKVIQANQNSWVGLL